TPRVLPPTPTLSATGPTGRVVIAVGDAPMVFDPQKSTAGVDNFFIAQVAEYLVRRDLDAKLIPGLATEWKASPDGLKVDVTLRAGVLAHNGEALDADDVVFSFQRASDPKVWPFATSFLRALASVEKVDPLHVRFSMKQKDVTFTSPEIASFRVRIIPKDYFEQVGDQKYGERPMATGPYMFVRQAPREYYDVTAFDRYWGDKARIKDGHFIVAPEDLTRMALLKTGDADLSISVPPPLVEDMRKTRGLKVVMAKTNYPQSIMINTLVKPFDDVRVRLAMNYAVDKEAIVRDLLKGMGTIYGVLLPGVMGYDASFDKPYPYNPQKAKQLLAEAGYPNGFETEYYGVLGGRIPLTKEVGEAVAGYLTAVGIKTKVVNEEYTAWNTRIRRATKPDLPSFGWMMSGPAGTQDPLGNFQFNFMCTGTYSWYCNKEYDDLVIKAEQTVDPNERATTYRELTRILYRDVPRIELYADVQAFALKEKLQWTPPPFNQYTELRHMWWER
ncbi:MAG: ABC transporter substrate-binding protein, partial [Chloroflexi bacterium]|nr:ABC transporter substrate-binding protein [Chloroflexota bacterium]